MNTQRYVLPIMSIDTIPVITVLSQEYSKICITDHEYWGNPNYKSIVVTNTQRYMLPLISKTLYFIWVKLGPNLRTLEWTGRKL